MKKILHFLVFGFFLVRPVRREATFDAILPTGNQTHVFLFLSNVSHFKTLNPTILDLREVGEKREGNFRIHYREFLHQVPFVKNEAYASYQAFFHLHLLLSHHVTSFYQIFNLHTRSKIKVSTKSAFEVVYEETIQFECPWIATQFCFKEIVYQRSKIIQNLINLFLPLDPKQPSDKINYSTK